MSPTRRRDGPVGDLEPDTVGARKAAFGAAALADRPGETRLDRRRRRVDVVAVETEPGFEPQRIPRAEADRLDFRLGEEGAGDAFRAIRADRDFKAVLAGIAGARNVAGEPVEPRCRRLHEGEADALRTMPRQNFGGARPLQGEERPVIGPQQPDIGGKPGLDMGEIRCLRGGIDDQHEDAVLAGIDRSRHHEVVENRAVGGKQLAVALPSRLEARGCRPGKTPRAPAPSPRGARRAGRPGPYARRRTGPPGCACGRVRPIFRSDIAPASRSRRTPPCGRRARDEAHEAACARAACRRRWSVSVEAAIGPPGMSSAAPNRPAVGSSHCRSAPPLSWDLRDFLRRQRGLRTRTVPELRPSVGYRTPRRATAAFQSVIPARSMGLSVSGAVAPSAPAGPAAAPDSSA